MRKYYLVFNDGFVFVSDSDRWKHTLMEIEATSFMDAQSKFRFRMRAAGHKTTMHIVGGKVNTETI